MIEKEVVGFDEVSREKAVLGFVIDIEVFLSVPKVTESKITKKSVSVSPSFFSYF